MITLTAAALPELSADELPGALRRIARFAPQRRAKLGGSAIAGALARDSAFRERIATRVVAATGELGEAVSAGELPAAADPVEVAALAYLVRPEGWGRLLDVATDHVQAAATREHTAAAARAAQERIERLQADLVASRAETERLRERLASVAAEAGSLREQVRQLNKELRDAREAQQRAAHLLATEKGRLQRAAAEHDAEVRRLRSRIADLEAALAGSRSVERESRVLDEARAWLLLETISQASLSLRRELGLEPAEKLPADLVAGTAAQPVTDPDVERRALEPDDPAWLDQLLNLPKAHLIIDGYNVTKRGYGELSLEQQRDRLVNRLGGLAAQTGAEITVVFDGAERVVGLPPPPRGVRVLFSRKGETADDLIRSLVRAEPPGRALVVVSSDREVADGVRRHGAYPVAADALLRRLARG